MLLELDEEASHHGSVFRAQWGAAFPVPSAQTGLGVVLATQHSQPSPSCCLLVGIAEAKVGSRHLEFACHNS